MMQFLYTLIMVLAGVGIGMILMLEWVVYRESKVKP